MLKNGDIICGLDLSLHCTGWSIIKLEDIENKKMKIIDYGTLDTSKFESLGESLTFVNDNICEILDKYKPVYIAAEQMFISRNRLTAIRLAQIHGVMLIAANKFKIPVTYYAVMTLKSKVLDGIKQKKENGDKKTGDEMKAEVKEKIIEIFGIENFKKDFNNDVTDSISAVVTFVKMDGKETEKIKKKKKTKKKEI